jgi:hypothetical protein
MEHPATLYELITASSTRLEQVLWGMNILLAGVSFCGKGRVSYHIAFTEGC